MNEKTTVFQGLRTLFIMGIVVLHTYGPYLLGDGATLCSFFFIISGFLYVLNSSTKGGAEISNLRYFYRKFIKMYPMYWCALGIAVLYTKTDSIFQLKFIPHFFLVQSWIPSPRIEGTVYFPFMYLGVSWFLSSLLFCYIFSPAIYKYVKSSKSENCLLYTSLGLLIIYLLENLQIYGAYRSWVLYISPFFRILEYIVGMYAGWFCINKKQQYHNNQNLVSVIFLLSYLYCLHCMFLRGSASILHVFFIVYVYIYQPKSVNLLLGNKFLVWLSNYLMFIYLVHVVVMNIINDYSNIQFHGYSLSLIVFFLSFLSSVGYSYLAKSIEKLKKIV